MLVSFQMTTFSDWLTKKLAEEGLKPADLAKRMGKDPSVISRFLSGERLPATETIVEIARALRVPPEEVFRAVVGLPPKGKPDERLDEALHVLGLLDLDDLDEIIQIARLKLDRDETNEKQSSRRRRPAQSALGNK
ncbi:MAG TPA: helix-turn-helix transcriptional regulator [Chloroflexi bacterium]|nr:helix-turn-helix transcriptional regulator [Chloroflexota bacterium]